MPPVAWARSPSVTCQCLVPRGHRPDTTHSSCCLAKMKVSPAASEGHTDLQLCVCKKIQTEAPDPGVQSYPTAEAYLKFTDFQPVAKTLPLYLFPTTGSSSEVYGHSYPSPAFPTFHSNSHTVDTNYNMPAHLKKKIPPIGCLQYFSTQA